MITVMWGLLNLLPIYPLDGGQIAQQIFVLTNPQDAMRQSLILSVIVGGMMAVIASRCIGTRPCNGKISFSPCSSATDLLELHDAHSPIRGGGMVTGRR